MCYEYAGWLKDDLLGRDARYGCYVMHYDWESLKLAKTIYYIKDKAIIIVNLTQYPYIETTIFSEEVTTKERI